MQSVECKEEDQVLCMGLRGVNGLHKKTRRVQNAMLCTQYDHVWYNRFNRDVIISAVRVQAIFWSPLMSIALLCRIISYHLSAHAPNHHRAGSEFSRGPVLQIEYAVSITHPHTFRHTKYKKMSFMIVAASQHGRRRSHRASSKSNTTYILSRLFEASCGWGLLRVRYTIVPGNVPPNHRYDRIILFLFMFIFTSRYVFNDTTYTAMIMSWWASSPLLRVHGCCEIREFG